MKQFISTWWQRIATPSMLMAATLCLLASLAGAYLKQLPVLNLFGALIIALLIGMLAQWPVQKLWSNKSADRKKGLSSAAGLIANKLLRLGIILLGFKLNLELLFTQGVKSLPLAALVVTVTILGTYALARALTVSPHLAMLTAGGTGICGAAAVMAISGSINSTDAEIISDEEKQERADNEVMAVATVAVMGTLFALLEIALLPALPLSTTQRGIVAGASLHEIAHAVAAGDALGAVDIATIMKLSRVLMLIIAAVVIAVWWSRKNQKALASGSTGPKKLPIPWFMLGFIAASVLGTIVPIFHAWAPHLVDAGYIFLGMAMAALGLNVNFKAMLSHGRNAVIASFIASVCLLGLSIGAAVLFF